MRNLVLVLGFDFKLPTLSFHLKGEKGEYHTPYAENWRDECPQVVEYNRFWIGEPVGMYSDFGLALSFISHSGGLAVSGVISMAMALSAINSAKTTLMCQLTLWWIGLCWYYIHGYGTVSNQFCQDHVDVPAHSLVDSPLVVL